MREPTSMTDPDEPEASHRFRTLPKRIRLEEMTTAQATEPPPPLTMGRDAERDLMLRNAGG